MSLKHTLEGEGAGDTPKRGRGLVAFTVVKLHRSENVLPECLKFSFKAVRNPDDMIRTPGYRQRTSFLLQTKVIGLL